MSANDPTATLAFRLQCNAALRRSAIFSDSIAQYQKHGSRLTRISRMIPFQKLILQKSSALDISSLQELQFSHCITERAMNNIRLTYMVGFGVFAIVSTLLGALPAAAKGCSGYQPPRPPFRGCVFGGVENRNPCHPSNENSLFPTCTPSPLFIWRNCETKKEWGTCKKYQKK
jgi:hypothetical protein